MLGAYLKRIFDVTKHGDAREESYYSGLEELINNYAESSGKKKTHVTTLPEKTGRPAARFEGAGDNRVRRYRYSEHEQRVYINETQYFEGITQETWEYQIGGYQVLNKWLKDRKERILSLEDLQHYCRVVTALARTIQIQAEIARLYPQVEQDTLAVELSPKA
ncbi:type ISP restriction/modification enzyme [Candidatus Methylomirabilis sp.]|uniref:type ISP restriction/modification enzyme n=1 Tax=Candidatus Methylomirabilis sp. TaxID=2032687 RepID=UPI002A6910D3|nr:hypothetical protein [Candidatus Methylomirabilis sp.]